MDLPLTGYVNLGKHNYLSEPQFLFIKCVSEIMYEKVNG